MMVSLNEVESVAYKAARGAGLSWGLAEEAAVAARWLARHGADWGPALADALENSSSLTVPAASARLPLIKAGQGVIHCPIRTGAWLSDVGVAPAETERPIVIDRVQSPLLLVAFAARLSRTVDVMAGGITARWRSARLAMPDGFPTAKADVSIVVRAVQDALQGSVSEAAVSPVPLDPAIAARLAALEARTYVPATAQSRLAGAGAGLADND